MSVFSPATCQLFKAEDFFVTFIANKCLMYKRAQLRRREIGLA
jgi:hypothetical protein